MVPLQGAGMGCFEVLLTDRHRANTARATQATRGLPDRQTSLFCPPARSFGNQSVTRDCAVSVSRAVSRMCPQRFTARIFAANFDRGGKVRFRPIAVILNSRARSTLVKFSMTAFAYKRPFAEPKGCISERQQPAKTGVSESKQTPSAEIFVHTEPGEHFLLPDMNAQN